MAKTRSAETFAEALADARAQLSLSKTAVGRKVGVTAKTVARWETGRFMPGFRERPRIVDALAGATPETERVLRATLEVPRVTASPSMPTSPRVLASDAIARLATDSALLAMAEMLPAVAVTTLRDALYAAVERLRSADVDVARASDALRPAP